MNLAEAVAAHHEQQGRLQLFPAGILLEGEGQFQFQQTLPFTEVHEARESHDMSVVDYLAPEQALSGHQDDRRSDVYSLGCVFCFLLTGLPPFPDGTISERLLKHQREEPPSLAQRRPDAPERLDVIMRRMLAKRPQDRYQTAGEVAAALHAWMLES